MKFKLTLILVSEALEDVGCPRSANPIAIPIDVLHSMYYCTTLDMLLRLAFNLIVNKGQ